MKIFLTAFTLFFTTLLSAGTPLDKMVVFGDSLSDNGNLYDYMKHQLPVSPPYFEGRFTNGPVWVELLMRSYYPTTSKEHLFDYAFGGAGVMEDDDGEDGFFTLRREMDSYFISHQDKADENSLYVVWIGSNNYLAIPEGNEIEKSLHDVDVGIQHGLQRLVDKGAKHIMVVNVPDLGRIPLAREFDAVEVLGYLAKQHNDTLQRRVNDLQNAYPDVQWLYFDINVLLHEIMDNPHGYGFTNITDTCYEEAVEHPSANTVLRMVSTAKPSFKNGACKGYLFFDPVHPSGAAHVIMAERTRKMFDESGIMFR
jgi:phospholipase/lecithinase/hemolysin